MTNTLLSALVNSAIAAAVLATALRFSLLLVPRGILSAAARYAIWWTTLLSTLLLPFAYLPVLSVDANAHIVAASRPMPSTLMVTPAAPSTVTLTRSSVHQAGLSLPLLITADGAPQWILIAWAFLSAVFLFRLLASLCLLARRKSGAVPVPAQLVRKVDAALLAHRSPRHVAVLSSRAIAAPVVAGLFRPTILIPERLLAKLSMSEVAAVALHEAAHVVRRDDYALLFERLLQSILPFHPVVWWILRQISLEREMACDAFAVQAIGSPQRYAACLVRVMELCNSARASWAAAGIAAGRSQFARRVDTLLTAARQSSNGRRKFRLVAAVAIVVAFVCLVAVTPRAVAFSTPPAPPQPLHSTPSAPMSPLTAAARPATPAQVPQPSPKPREPQAFPRASAQDPPLSVMLVVDRSGSMRQNDNLIDAAVTALTKSANPADEFLLIKFSDAVNIAGPYANDVASILQELHRGAARGGTSLRDAILNAIEWKGARYPDRRLIVISDGDDNTSSISSTQLRDAVIPAKVPIFAITLASPFAHPRPGSRWLEDLAARAQGREFVTNDLSDVTAVAGQILRYPR